MSHQLPFLVLAAPLFGALVCSIVGWFKPRWCFPIAVIAVAASLAASINLFALVGLQPDHQVAYQLGGWQAPFGIQYIVDPLNALVLVVITAVALLAVLAAPASLAKDLPDRERFVFPLMCLLVTGLLGMTLTGDAFNLYVMLEITSLSSYALVAMGKGRAVTSCFTYIIMGTVGASFYLLGVGYLYIKTGTLNMADLQQILAQNDLHLSISVITGFILMTVGLWIKMGLFPLHGWLPNAYAYAPHASSNLLAPLMTKVSVYIAVRIMVTVFTPAFLGHHQAWSQVALTLATIAIVAGSLIAYSQTDIKKLLAYLIVAEVGYMVGGMWLLNPTGLKGTIYHIAADALMTCCLFLGAAGVITATGNRHLHAFRGAAQRMPWTFAAIILGGLSMVGVPPTCGFFSKWFLISGAMDEGAWHFIAALLFSSLMNALILFRIIESGYFKDIPHPMDDPTGTRATERCEAPWGIRGPLLASSVGILILGVYAAPVGRWIERFIVAAGVN